MKYFYLYVVYNKWNLVRTTRFWDTLYQVSKHCYNVILYITSSIFILTSRRQTLE
jgi:hypothetical protein